MQFGKHEHIYFRQKHVKVTAMTLKRHGKGSTFHASA